MKEVEYRSWHKNKMIYNCNIIAGKFAIEENPKESKRIINEDGEHYYNAWAEYKVYNSPLMQYTGIKDKNGEKIFEGDILRFSDKLNWYCIKAKLAFLYNDKETIEEIINNHNKYPFEDRIINMPECYDWLLSSEIKDYWEIIGNIYETPI